MATLDKNISPAQLDLLRKTRWRARTDTLFLARHILGFRDVCPEVHGPFMNILQTFPEVPEEDKKICDIVQPGMLRYRPWRDPYTMEGKRRALILDPRSGLKTTVNCVTHTIQWILNFPHLAYLIVQSNTKKAEDIVREIKQHFQYNTVFRNIFPDYVPQRRIGDWGNRQEFDVPDEDGRQKLLNWYASIPELNTVKTRREHTVMTTGIDKGTAGYHFDVMKFSDIVEENNTRTTDQMKQVAFSFRMMENLLVKPQSWIDVEGTRYSNSDLYGEIIERWMENESYKEQWNIHVRSCFLREYGGAKPFYTPDSLRLPFKKDETGNLISWWPGRIPLKVLLAQQADDAYVFATQKLNDPVGFDDDTKIFPMRYLRWITAEDFARVPISFYSVTVDTADTVGVRSNDSCITTCAWDKFGRCYVVEALIGKYLPDQIIHNILVGYERFRPAKILVEETAFVRGLKPSILRAAQKKGITLPLDFIKRETNVSKIERISNTLQPWYKAGEIIFLDNLADKHRIMKELDQFPSGVDDFLDTLADQFQNREWFGRLAPRHGPSTTDYEKQQILKATFEGTLGIGDPLADGGYSISAPPARSLAWKTGGL